MSLPALVDDAQTIVIKIGSVLIRDPKTNKVREDWFEAFAQDIKSLHDRGKNIVIVSSGAVALGRETLGVDLNTPPENIPLAQKQASSAIGQFHLFAAYFQTFSKCNLKAAQVLLTMSETENRRMHLNAREALATLMSADVIPIINENDVVSTGEIRFGDNDRLAVRVAQMIDADMVVLMSTTDGLYSADPRDNADAEHFSVVEAITSEHIKMAGKAVPGLSTGGMKSKIEAAASATKSGIDLIIANGVAAHAVQKALKGKSKSTWFKAQKSDANARKIWLQAHLSPKGMVVIDEGAQKALEKGSSLLPVGVVSIEGTFERGDVLSVHSVKGKQLGLGLSAYNSNDAKALIGKPSDQIESILGCAGRHELIHRNDMALQDS